MKKNSDNAVILFAREPVLGLVKTRLNSFLDKETILRLYVCFLEDSLAKIQDVGNADCFVAISPEGNSEFFNQKKSSDITLFSQQGNNLGEKMRQAFVDRFSQGYTRAIIIGSDSPSLPVSYIRRALGSEKDLVLGPSIDGGYYLIAMKDKVSEVFKSISWGTDKVLDETLQRIKDVGISFDLLPLWYDVDLPEDLKFLKTHLMLCEEAGLGDGGMTKKILDDITFK